MMDVLNIGRSQIKIVRPDLEIFNTANSQFIVA